MASPASAAAPLEPRSIDITGLVGTMYNKFLSICTVGHVAIAAPWNAGHLLIYDATKDAAKAIDITGLVGTMNGKFRSICTVGHVAIAAPCDAGHLLIYDTSAGQGKGKGFCLVLPSSGLARGVRGSGRVQNTGWVRVQRRPPGGQSPPPPASSTPTGGAAAQPPARLTLEPERELDIIPKTHWGEVELSRGFLEDLEKNEKLRIKIPKIDDLIADVRMKAMSVKFAPHTQEQANAMADSELEAVLAYTHDTGLPNKEENFYFQMNASLRERSVAGRQAPRLTLERCALGTPRSSVFWERGVFCVFETRGLCSFNASCVLGTRFRVLRSGTRDLGIAPDLGHRGALVAPGALPAPGLRQCQHGQHGVQGPPGEDRGPEGVREGAPHPMGRLHFNVFQLGHREEVRRGEPRGQRDRQDHGRPGEVARQPLLLPHGARGAFVAVQPVRRREGGD